MAVFGGGGAAYTVVSVTEPSAGGLLMTELFIIVAMAFGLVTIAAVRKWSNAAGAARTTHRVERSRHSFGNALNQQPRVAERCKCHAAGDCERPRQPA